MGRENILALSQLAIFRGDTRQILVALLNDAGTGPRDLTGNTYALTVNRERNPTDATNQIMTIVGIIVGTPTDGIAGFSPVVGDYSLLLDSEFVELDSGEKAVAAWYDIEETDPSTGLLTIGKGVFVIVQDIGK